MRWPVWCVRLDKKIAAILGWTGRYTISAECGRRLPPFHRYCILCRLLRWLNEAHCVGAATEEGTMSEPDYQEQLSVDTVLILALAVGFSFWIYACYQGFQFLSSL